MESKLESFEKSIPTRVFPGAAKEISTSQTQLRFDDIVTPASQIFHYFMQIFSKSNFVALYALTVSKDITSDRKRILK